MHKMKKLYIVYTRDMDKIFDELQEEITTLFTKQQHNDNNINYHQITVIYSKLNVNLLAD